MPVPGVKPKDGNKRYRGASMTEWVEVESTPFDGPIPDLPALPDGDVWPEQTIEWYETVSHLPHARLWDEGMWQFIITTAMLHAAIWRNPTDPHTGRLAELRAREKQFGLTPDHRRDLRIRYVDVVTATATVTNNDGSKEPVTAVITNLRPRTNALGS